ncbi:phosphotransferase family protein [Microvirga sp. TS319]|uniref:phosphotransferase family protein n=1 Tax=Microvirga sp. TS319 TaxID=3241165 RepID=UPI00351A2828
MREEVQLAPKFKPTSAGRLSGALKKAGVLVPNVVLDCEDREILGTPFYIMDRLEGRVFHDGALPGGSSDERRHMYRSHAQALAALHNVDPASVGLSDYGKSGNYFARQIGRWTRQWELSRTRTDANIDRLIEWLPKTIPEDDATVVTHGDFRIGNIMIHHWEPRVIAILDWELSTLDTLWRIWLMPAWGGVPPRTSTAG